ncbi:MAG: hypothetical protein EA425_06190 [Puniceicoccaceae bacterium]|nr:MAG: hypothetical protein EA425_06190 [Puniceicoccaceae bacterium]
MAEIKNGKRIRAKDRNATADYLIEISREFRRRRKARLHKERYRSQLECSRERFFGNGLREPAELPSGTLVERARLKVVNRLQKWLRINVSAFSGYNEFTVRYGETPSAITVTEKGEQYSSRCKYHMTDATHTVTIRQDYWHKVIRLGSVGVEGSLILDLEPVEHPSRTVYAAKMARVKGKRLAEETGYVAVGAYGWEQAPTIAGLCSKLKRLESAQ